MHMCKSAGKNKNSLQSLFFLIIGEKGKTHEVGQAFFETVCMYMRLCVYLRACVCVFEIGDEHLLFSLIQPLFSSLLLCFFPRFPSIFFPPSLPLSLPLSECLSPPLSL